MSRFTTYARRHILWFGFLAVLAPLVILLSLQYGWLVSLEKTSVVAHQATLSNFLEAVASEVEYFYRSVAERALNLPAGPLPPGGGRFVLVTRGRSSVGPDAEGPTPKGGPLPATDVNRVVLRNGDRPKVDRRASVRAVRLRDVQVRE